MAIYYDGQSMFYTNVLKYINYGLTLVFVTETSLKLITFRLTFFNSSLNTFYFTIIVGSLIDILFSNLNMFNSLTFVRLIPQLLRIVRVMRLSRLFRLMKKHPGLLALIKTIMFSMPSLLNVFLLLLLLFFIYAVLG